MDRDIHSDPLIYRTVVASEGLRLSEDTIDRVVDIQKRYKRQGHSIGVCESFSVNKIS